MIPALTHQTAASAVLPCAEQALRQRLIALNPDWRHCFYDDRDCRELLRREAPGLLEVHDRYPTGVQRSDLFRVAVVYLRGGVYLDTDMESARPLDGLSGETCVLAEEKTLDADEALRLGHSDRLRIANYMFASAPRHPFWLCVLDRMIARAGQPVGSDGDILESTGPGLFSTVFGEVRETFPDITLLPHPGGTCRRCGGRSCAFGDYAAHLHHGSWRKPAYAAPIAAPPDTEAAARTIAHWQTGGDEVPGCVVLKTYDGAASDGLSSVYDLVRNLAPERDDTRQIAGAKVVVAGVPFLYADRLSPANRNILVTTWETSQLPSFWVEAINAYFHHCIVPHPRVQRLFRASGVTSGLSVVQQGFARYPRAEGRGIGPRVGFNGVPVRRKNLTTLHRACRLLLADWPELRLAVHVATWYDWLDPGPFQAIRDDPMVDWTEGHLDAAGMGTWYGGLDCYAYPSAAEGWSFTPRESLFLGIPTVLSDIEMHRDLTASGHCWPIPVRGPEAAIMEGGVFGNWDRVEVEDIAATIAQVLSDPEAARTRAARGANWIETRWTTDDARRVLADIVSAL